MHDWFANLVREWETHPLQLWHPYTQGRLQFKAGTERRDILHQESAHANFRRRAKIREVQNRGEELAELIAEYHVPRICSRRQERVLVPLEDAWYLTLPQDEDDAPHACVQHLELVCA